MAVRADRPVDFLCRLREARPRNRPLPREKKQEKTNRNQKEKIMLLHKMRNYIIWNRQKKDLQF